jgi:predicted small lipoprotein YifL
MRKLFALSMVALLALTLAIAVVGCGQKAAEETPAATETTPSETMTDSTAMPEAGSMTTTDSTAAQH